MYSNPIIFIIMQRDIYYNFYFMPLSENSYYFIYAPHSLDSIYICARAWAALRDI
jgi:hypothetical protein